MEADIASRYEIPRTVQFLRDGAYTRVALQVILPQTIPRRFVSLWIRGLFVGAPLILRLVLMVP
jgi:hypothetical protein